jgi:hypothetical protein
MAAANPFDGNNVVGNPYPNQGLVGFQQIENPDNRVEVVNLNDKLQALKDQLTQKYAETQQMGTYQNVIVNNLQIIKARVGKLATLIEMQRTGLDRVRFELENRMDDTLDNILSDIDAIQGAQTNAIVAEVAELQNMLDAIGRQGAPDAPLQAYGAAGQPLDQATWNAPGPAADNPGALPNPPQANQPPGLIVGGKKKKGGYTYPKMRSRSRLRSHPRITHKFNTIKPKKKKSRRHRKHKKSAKKHRKH